MNRGIPPNAMIKPKEIQDIIFIIEKPTEYIQSNENNLGKVAIQVLAITLKKRKNKYYKIMQYS